MKNSHVVFFAHHYFQDIESDVAEESDVDFNPDVIWVSSDF